MSKSSSEIVCFGEMLIEFVPNVPGVSLAESAGFLKAPGGAPANVACAIAKLGGSSAFIGKLGEDEFGNILFNVLKDNGVNCEGVCFDIDARTALAFVTLNNDGEREFMIYRNPSADMMLKRCELNKKLIKNARIFHFGSISLIAQPCRSAHLEAMKVAKKAGALLSYDPNIRLPLWPSNDACREGIMSIWNRADVIKVSDEEVKFLTQQDAAHEKSILSLWHDGLKLMLVTDGQTGCRYFTQNFRGAVKGYSEKEVDTTGAGDAFLGSFLHCATKDFSILEDESKLRGVLRMSIARSTICKTRKKAIPPLPDNASAQKIISDSL